MNLLDLIYPKQCLGCGGWGKYICEKCEVGMGEVEQINPRGDLDGLASFWEYEGIVKMAIEEVKYKGSFDMLREIVPMGIKMIQEERFGEFRDFLSKKPIIVPVPLFSKREKERGFNQSKMISLSLRNVWKLEVKDLLVRIRDTGHQVGRTRDERLVAVKGAFMLNNKCRVTNDKVLLVDDVWTTGATMQECAKTLRKAGVDRVWGLVLAR